MLIEFARRKLLLVSAIGFALALSADVHAQKRTGARATGRSQVAGIASTSSYDDLLALFRYWREFQKPKVTDGVPDYTVAAMAAQKKELPSFQQRLAAINPNGWSIPQQVDYQILRAEMNGLDFDHRVLQPWVKNPAFYSMLFLSQSDQPAREGPVISTAIEAWKYKYPLTRPDAVELASQIGTIPKVLAQAKVNLTGNARDLWIAGAVSMAEQSETLSTFAKRVAGADPQLDDAISRAKDATDQFHTWLVSRSNIKRGPSGIGVENYNWYLKNVQLVPYTWQDEVTLMWRELSRAHASLKLAEERNRNLPALVPVANAADHDNKFNAGVTEYMKYLQDNNVMTVRDYMDPALRAKIGKFNPGEREFFSEVDARDRMIMLTHDYHWFDLARLEKEPPSSPVRQVPLLYNIFDTRTEGFATGWEEMMLNHGMFDQHPHANELIYILVAERAARALGDLMMHSNQMTHEQAVEFASDWTPRGWLRVNGNTDWHEQHLYLQQPAYGTSYIIGKVMFDQVIAERARQLGDQFTLKRFMDEFNAVGMIPASLVRWELTGNKDPILGATRPTS